MSAAIEGTAPAAMTQVQRYGAAPGDWNHFMILGLTADLLPVVSNPKAKISEKSELKALGKVPSTYDANQRVVGFHEWTTHTSTEREVSAWARQPDYGVGLQCRRVRAIDADVDDPVLAREIAEFVKGLGYDLPRRQRRNSEKFLLVFAMPDVRIAKVVVPCAQGQIEFLGNGQQFVAVGTHPTGVRYEWVGGLPADIPVLTLDQYADLLTAVRDRFGSGKAQVVKFNERKRGPDVWMPDPLADYLRDNGLVLREKERALVVACPWAGEHSTGAEGDGSTLYFPAGSKSYDHGAFKCLHGHCEGRRTSAFARAVGFVDPDDTPEAEFGDLPDEPPEGQQTPDAGEAGPAPHEDSDAGGAARPANVFDPRDWPAVASTLRDQEFGSEAPTLRRFLSTWYLREGAHFTEVSTEDVGVTIQRFLARAKRFGRVVNGVHTGPTPFMPTKHDGEEVANALKSLVHLKGKTVPCWCPGVPRPPGAEHLPAGEVISMRNGLFHLPSKALFEHSAGFFTLNSLGFDYDPAAACPQWLAFLSTVWGDDPQSIDTLQEIFGYVLSHDLSQHRIFSLVGPPRSGKGTIAWTLRMLLGPDNVCSPTLQSLSGRFGMQPLIGKLLVTIGDARSAGFSAQATIERLLSISGGDAINVERKNRDAWDGRLNARLMILSNETLNLPDASGALASRFLVLKMNRSYLGKEDRGLAARIEPELTGIFRWALEGLDRLASRRHFIQPESARHEIEAMSELNSPIVAFAEDCLDFADPRAQTPKQKIYGAFRNYYSARGLNPPSEGLMSKNLAAAFPKLTTTRPRVNGILGPRCFAGVRLSAAEEAGGLWESL